MINQYWSKKSGLHLVRYALHRKRCNRGSDTLTPTKFGGYSNRKTAFGLKKKL